MRPDERDSAYLWDTMEAAKTVRDFTSGLTFDRYQRDKKLRLAVERSIEIIGEAAARVFKGNDKHTLVFQHLSFRLARNLSFLLQP